MGRLVRGFPVMQGVATTCCLSLGQGVVGSQGMGCSAFSPDRRGKGQHCCRERQLGRDYNTAVLWTWTRAPCYRGMLGRDCAQPWQRNLAPLSRIRIPDFHNTRSPNKVNKDTGCWDRLQTMLLPSLQWQGTPGCPCSSLPPHSHYLLMFGLQPSKYQGQLL